MCSASGRRECRRVSEGRIGIGDRVGARDGCRCGMRMRWCGRWDLQSSRRFRVSYRDEIGMMVLVGDADSEMAPHLKSCWKMGFGSDWWFGNCDCSEADGSSEVKLAIPWFDHD